MKFKNKINLKKCFWKFKLQMDIFSVSYGMFSVVFAIVENISFGE